MGSDDKSEIIKGRQFDAPLYVAGQVSGEPQRYLAESPYELSKFEFSVLKKGKFRTDAWFRLASGATAGLCISIAGKLLNALVQAQQPNLEFWELWAVGVGLLVAMALGFLPKSEEEKEFNEVKEYIRQHFETSPPRRVHLAGREED